MVPINGHNQYIILQNTSIWIKTSEGKIESIVGTFLYYGRCVEPNILTALNGLAIYPSNLTTDTFKSHI